MKNFSQIIKAAIKVSCLSLVIITQCAGASANDSRGQKESNTEGGEFKYQTVSHYQELPEVPRYSGQFEFVRGVIYPGARGGTSVSYTLTARENKQTVIRWYQDVLKMYKWEMDSEQSLNGVSARKGKNHVQISVAPSGRQAFGSDIVICYMAGSR